MSEVIWTLASAPDWRLVMLAGLVCLAALIAILGMVQRACAARGGARIGWLAGALVSGACGVAAACFVLFAVDPAEPAGMMSALTVAGVTLALLGASILAAVMDRRLAEKNVLLDTALNNMNHGLMMFDRNSRVILCNQRYVDLYGLPAGAITPGLTLRQVIERRIAAGTFEGDPDSYCAAVLGAVSRGETSKKLTKTPAGRIIEVVGEPLADGGWVATHQDVTEELRRESSFRFLFDDNPLPMWVWEHSTLRFLAANNAALEKYGYDREQFLGLTVRDIKRSGDWRSLDAVSRGDERRLREGLVSVHTRADGATFDVELYGRSMVHEGRPASLVAAIDITQRKRAEDELRSTREFLNTVLESVPSVIVVKDARDLSYVYVNRAYEQQFGLPREQAIGKTSYELFDRATADTITERDRQALAAGEGMFFDTHAVTTSQGARYITSQRMLIRDDKGAPRYVLSVVNDVTERKQRDDELRRTRTFLDTIIENMPAILSVKDAHDQRYILVNKGAEEAFGVPREKMLGRRSHDVLPKEAADLVSALDKDVIDSGELRVIEHVIQSPDHGARTLTTKKLIVRDEHGAPQYLLSLSEDMTERKRAQDQIAHLARHDVLTDLPNRLAFNEKLASVIEQSTSANEMFAVLCIDVDRFKEVNDVFGQAAGDAVLCEVTRRLGEAAEGAFLARLGGDEFALIVTGGAQPSTAAASAEALLHAVSTDIQVGQQHLRIGLSIGVAVHPSDGKDATALLANANAALYRSKEAGRGTIRFFEAHMDERLRERRALQHELRDAIERNELTLHYQPQARIGGEIIGFEALVRWHHPARGVISPGTFIPLAEESGLIIALGESVLREACREAASWPRPLQIAVNLSPIQFRDGDLPTTVHEILLETGLAPSRLELEITEGVLISDFARAVSILRRLKLLGVRIAMDDFGTGYSSLSYLQSFPFDKIKIDRTFISNLTDNHYSATIVRAVIGLGRGLHLPVMAEGVETSEQLAALARESCDEVQGYLIGRPAPIETYAETVGRRAAPKLKLVHG